MREVRCSAFPEEPQARGSIDPALPFSADVAGEAPAQLSPVRLSMLLSQPTPDAPPYPVVELIEVSAGPCGVTVVVAPPGQDRVQPVDERGEAVARGRRLHQSLDLVAQVIQRSLRNEEIADPAPRLERLGLRYPVAEEVEAFPDIGDPGLFHRQVHAKFLFEEACQRVLFRFRLLARPRDENDEVVRVAHHEEGRPTSTTVVKPSVGCILRVLARTQGPAAISFVERCQVRCSTAAAR